MGKKQPSPGKRAGSKNLPPWEAKKQEEKDFGKSSAAGKRARQPRKYKDNREARTSRPDKEGTDFRGRPISRNFRGDDDRGGERRPSPRFDDREGRSNRPRREDGDFKGRPSDRKFDSPRPQRRDDDRGGYKGRPSDRSFGAPRGRRDGDGDKKPFYNDRDKRNNYGGRRDDAPRERRHRFDDFQGFSGPRVKKVEQMPLNKYLAHSGVCARREAAELIKEGKVMVNGKVVDTPGYKVQPEDKVTMSGKKLTPQKDFVYVLLNKPKDFLTTTDDPEGRKTVMDLVKGVPNDRIYPVGRLDRNTTGLLLLTNDGDLAQKLSHPKYNVKKIYQVTLDKDLTGEDFTKIMEGFDLEDGSVKVDAMSYLETKNEIGIEIHSGRNRIVRRIFENFGYKVEKLDRVMYAGLTKKNINRGKWRLLTEKEIVLLKHFKS